jgi:hypothetical protein
LWREEKNRRNRHHLFFSSTNQSILYFICLKHNFCTQNLGIL